MILAGIKLRFNLCANIPGVVIYEYIFVSIFGFSEKILIYLYTFRTLLTLGLTIKKNTKDKFDYLIFTPISFVTLPIFGYTYRYYGR